MYLLGYDIGSSSVKASLVNAESGKCVSSAFFPKTEADIIAVKPGWAEQDPGNWWENLKLATQAVLAESGVNAEDIKAIGISYQMHQLAADGGQLVIADALRPDRHGGFGNVVYLGVYFLKCFRCHDSDGFICLTPSRRPSRRFAHGIRRTCRSPIRNS